MVSINNQNNFYILNIRITFTFWIKTYCISIKLNQTIGKYYVTILMAKI